MPGDPGLLAAGPRLTGLPAFSQAAARPVFTHGVQSGDVDVNPVRLAPLNALPGSELAVKRLLEQLPADQEIFYRMVAADLADVNPVSEPIVGRFRTAPASPRPVRFAWSGDTAGQGWGIDETGMKTYGTIARHEPDFFLHSGDTIYADGPMTDSVDLADGTVWRNLVLIEGKLDDTELWSTVLDLVRIG